MNKNDQQEPSDTPQSVKPKKAITSIGIVCIVVIVAVLVVGGVGYGGYIYGSKNTVDDARGAMNPVEDRAAQTEAPNNENSYRTVLAKGYPWRANYSLTTKLAIPSRLQAVAISSDIQDPGLTDILANKFNVEMGRWLVGNPELADTSFGSLSIIQIDDEWLKESAINDDTTRFSINGYVFTTPSQKESSLARLKSDTEDCIKDDTEGFTISNTFNVCYTPKIERQAVGSYSPWLALSGYGVVEGERYVLFGQLTLLDKEYTDEVAEKNAVAFVDGDIPSETKNMVEEYVDALKNSTITTGDRF